MDIIPKIIHQTWKSHELPSCIKENVCSWKNKNPDYVHIFYDNKDGLEFLYKYFGTRVARAFCILQPGPFKADLLRYALLYIHGGVYSDVDLFPCYSLKDIIDNNYDVISVNEKGSYKGIWQGFIASKPKCQLFKKVINRIVENVEKKFYPSNNGPIVALSITGPVLLFDVFKEHNKTNQYKIHLFQYISDLKGRRVVDGQRTLFKDKLNKDYEKKYCENYGISVKRRKVYDFNSSELNILKNLEKKG